MSTLQSLKPGTSKESSKVVSPGGSVRRAEAVQTGRGASSKRTTHGTSFSQGEPESFRAVISTVTRPVFQSAFTKASVTRTAGTASSVTGSVMPPVL